MKHPSPSDTTSHPSISLNKFTHNHSFQSLLSISTSLMKHYGDCDPVDNLNQDKNNYYVSPKIPSLEKLGNHSLSMVLRSNLVFEQEPLLTSSILISDVIDTQLLGVHHQKNQVHLKSMALNVTTPTSESVNTGPSPWSPYTFLTSLPTHQVILTNYYILYPIVHISTIYFIWHVPNHTTTRLCTDTPLF